MSGVKVRIKRWDHPAQATSYEAHILCGSWPMREWVCCGRADTQQAAEEIATAAADKEIERRARRAEQDDIWRKTRCTIVRKLTIYPSRGARP